MKRSINFIMAIVGVFFLLTFSSCLKNSKYYADLSKVGASIDMPLAAANGNAPVAFTFVAADTPVTYPIYVNVASPKKLGVPVTATLGLDTAYMDQYNSNNGTDYELLPDSTYTVNNLNLTVPANQRLAYATVSINTGKIQGGHDYVLPFTIVKASLPIENWNHLMVNTILKNIYDGYYNVSIVLVHPSAGGTYNQSGIHFSTVNATTFQCNLGVAQIFGASMNVTVNADNSLTITSSAVSIVQDAGLNYYDPSTKTFHFSYGWGGGTRHVTGTAAWQHS
ncbi:MAG: DUF1735 domain-containing protein [Chitinophagaceae bacterium]|nr:MAG: DUF1735 domain-containing protein [Chitinophagaceae bacterium]